MKPIAGIAAAILLAATALAAAPPIQGDPKRGEVAFQKCYACHALEPGKNLSGPSLHRIFGRRIAAAPGFDYSPALRGLATRTKRWDPALLDRFIGDPEALAPHTSMTFTGMRNAQERADLIAFLKSPGARRR